MKIAAITKFRHGELHEALNRIGLSMSEFCRRTGFSYNRLCRIMSLRQRPSKYLSEKLTLAFLQFGIDLDCLNLWPEEFQLGSSMAVEQIADIDPRDLLMANENTKLLSADNDLISEVMDAISSLEKNYPEMAHAVRGTLEGKSDLAMAKERGVTRSNIGSLKIRAVERIRKILNEREKRVSELSITKRHPGGYNYHKIASWRNENIESANGWEEPENFNKVMKLLDEHLEANHDSIHQEIAT